MQSPLLKKSDGLVALLIALYALLLAALPSLLSLPEFKRAFSEQGPFEILSIATWIFASLFILLAVRPLSRSAWIFSLLFLCFAAREADWHKKFTADSILKSNYYRYTEAPGGEKLLAALVALVFIAMIVYAGLVILRFLFLRAGWRSRAGLWLLAAASLVVLGKMLDRAPAELALAGHGLGESTKLYAQAFEEGLEMIHPLIFAWATWCCRSGASFFARARD